MKHVTVLLFIKNCKRYVYTADEMFSRAKQYKRSVSQASSFNRNAMIIIAYIVCVMANFDIKAHNLQYIYIAEQERPHTNSDI